MMEEFIPMASIVHIQGTAKLTELVVIQANRETSGGHAS
jgi:hypothetical protein